MINHEIIGEIRMISNLYFLLVYWVFCLIFQMISFMCNSADEDISLSLINTAEEPEHCFDPLVVPEEFEFNVNYTFNLVVSENFNLGE